MPLTLDSPLTPTLPAGIACGQGEQEGSRRGVTTFQQAPTSVQAPHICVTVFARGLLNHLVTRLYFADEPANAEDVVLQCVPSERRATLLARRKHGGAIVVYHFDIILQGAGETVFFNL